MKLPTRKEVGATIRSVGLQVVAAIVTTVLIALAVYVWRHALSRAARSAWQWLHADTSVPNPVLLVLALLSTVAIVGFLVGWGRRRQAKAPAEIVPPPIAEAEAFRAAYAAFVDDFLACRDEALGGMPYQHEFDGRYRELRRSVIAAHTAIAAHLRDWLKGVDEVYTTPLQDEPTWVDPVDGPDDSEEALISKFWLPLTFVQAIGFWKPLDGRELRLVAAERIDLVDAFVRFLSRPPEEEEELSLGLRLRGRWRRLRRKVTRKRRRPTRKAPSGGEAP